MEETFGNGETKEREMNECGGGIRGGQAAAMAADGCVCMCTCVCVCVCVGQEEREAGLPGRLCAGVGR